MTKIDACVQDCGKQTKDFETMPNRITVKIIICCQWMDKIVTKSICDKKPNGKKWSTSKNVPIYSHLTQIQHEFFFPCLTTSPLSMTNLESLQTLGKGGEVLWDPLGDVHRGGGKILTKWLCGLDSLQNACFQTDFRKWSKSKDNHEGNALSNNILLSSQLYYGHSRHVSLSIWSWSESPPPQRLKTCGGKVFRRGFAPLLEADGKGQGGEAGLWRPPWSGAKVLSMTSIFDVLYFFRSMLDVLLG